MANIMTSNLRFNFVIFLGDSLEFRSCESCARWGRRRVWEITNIVKDINDQTIYGPKVGVGLCSCS